MALWELRLVANQSVEVVASASSGKSVGRVMARSHWERDVSYNIEVVGAVGGEERSNSCGYLHSRLIWRAWCFNKTCGRRPIARSNKSTSTSYSVCVCAPAISHDTLLLGGGGGMPHTRLPVELLLGLLLVLLLLLLELELLLVPVLHLRVAQEVVLQHLPR